VAGIDAGRGCDRQRPHARIAKRSAFYRILLRHQDGVGSGKAQIFGTKTMVVGKAARFEREPEVVQVHEETCGIADAGDRHEPHRLEGLGRLDTAGIQEVAKLRTAQRHGESRHIGRQPRYRLLAIQDYGVDFAQARQRLAQGSGGQRQSIAETACGIHNGDLYVALERMVLQAVVTQQRVDLGMRLEQGACILAPVGSAPYRTGQRCCQQHRLIASHRWIVIATHVRRHACVGRIGAGDDRGSAASFGQAPGKPLYERRLAGPAGGDIADDDDRNRQAGAFEDAHAIELATHGCDGPVRQGERQQKVGQPGWAIPQALEAAHSGAVPKRVAAATIHVRGPAAVRRRGLLHCQRHTRSINSAAFATANRFSAA
jgi:hypothetical protein